MGLFDRFFKQEEKPTEKKEAPKVMFNKLNAYSSKTNRRYKDYAKDGYQENAIVHRCIQLISNSASAVKIDVFSGDTKLDNHELISLLQRPNPLQSGVEYFSSLYSYLLISGNSYLLRDTEGFTPPRELYLLRPDRIEIKANESIIPESYNYVIDGVTRNVYRVDPTTGQGQIKQIKLWSPLDDFYGLSPIMASAYNIDQHNLAGMHNVALLKNGCTPSGMLKFEPTDETGMSTQLTDDQRARLLEDLEFRFQGTHNSGRPMLLEGNFSYQQLGLNPKDMDFLELLNLSAREIALCFGVPAQLIGIPDSQTYSNMETAKLALYEETVIPLLSRVESDLNEYLSPLYDGDIRIQYDLDSIPAMAEKRKQVYENVVQGVNAGILTRNEARDRLGLEEVTGGDDLYIPSNLFPIGETETSPEDSAKPVEVDEAEKAFEEIYGTKEEVSKDVFTTEEEAIDRAEEIGCVGTHSHEQDGKTIYMPCRTHAEYDRLIQEEKALSDLDLTPSDSMANEAQRGLDWRKEFNRGGTAVGVARARDIVNKTRLSPNTVLRMYSFFSRHEVDKQGQGFDRGEDGYPSAGRIAWALWGGDAGFSWAKTKRNQIMREREKSFDDMETKVEGVSGSTLKGLENKVKEHNDKHGDKKGKRVTVGMLARVFKRGIGAYRNNPQSVRPSVRSEDQWAMARVNAFLSAVRTGKFSGGKFDLDLLPKDHPLSSKD
jgi:HK97 family phage portal protein